MPDATGTALRTDSGSGCSLSRHRCRNRLAGFQSRCLGGRDFARTEAGGIQLRRRLPDQFVRGSSLVPKGSAAAKKCDAPIIVVEMLGGLERHGWAGLANCPRLRLSGGIDCDFEEIVEIAVSETLRIAHHRSRSAAMLAFAGIDPGRVEVVPRTPDLLRLVGLVASNAEAVRLKRRPKDLILHPDPRLLEDELSVLRMVDPNFQFLTPSTIIIDTVTTETV
jgi:hypothetical protein